MVVTKIKVRTTRTCSNPICSKNPYFGWRGQKAVFCVSHKTAGMVDVKNKRCEDEECMKRGLFGYDGERARFCGTHRLQGMVDLKNKRCKWVGCAKQANFAEEGLTTAAFCLEHRTPGMVDVKGHRCSVENCTKVAGYGVEGGRPTSCLFHRKSGMVDMKQHRPRRPRLPVARKPNGLNVKLSGREDAGISLAERCGGKGRGNGNEDVTSLPSRGVGVASKEGGVAGKSSNPDDNLMLLPPVSRLEPCPDLDLLHPASYPHLYSSGGGGGGNLSHPQVHWHSDPVASSNQFGGSSSGNSNGGHGKIATNDQPLRSWRRKPATSDNGVPTVGAWAFNGQTSDGSGNGNGGGAQQLPSPQYMPASHHQESSMPPSVSSMRGPASLPTPNRFGSGGGGYLGERSGIDGGGWRSPAFNEGLQLSAVNAAIDQPGYGDLSSLGVARGAGGDVGVLSVVKTEQEAIASGELHMPEPESADAWLRELMHGAIVREINNSASQQQQQQQHRPQQHQPQQQQHQHQQHPIYSSGVVLGANSNHHLRNFGSPQSMKPESRGPSHHAAQHQHSPQASVLSLSNVSRMKGSTATTRIEPTTSLSTSTVAGRSPSSASSGASPPDEPESFDDAAPQGSYQHDLARAGGGGGNHGLASMVNSRAGIRGATGPPNHLFSTNLPGITGAGCDRGYGTAGFSTDMSFPPLARVASPAAWGGF